MLITYLFIDFYLFIISRSISMVTTKNISTNRFLNSYCQLNMAAITQGTCAIGLTPKSNNISKDMPSLLLMVTETDSYNSLFIQILFHLLSQIHITGNQNHLIRLLQYFCTKVCLLTLVYVYQCTYFRLYLLFRLFLYQQTSFIVILVQIILFVVFFK